MATKKQEMKPDDGRRILVAGIGNVLRGDDGFGNAVAQQHAMRRATQTDAGRPHGRPATRHNHRLRL